MSFSLPTHLRKYVVEQNYEKYTPVDQAVWRFILRQLKSFLALNAHECYLEGLQKTGIEIERIPRISDISEKLSQFGWRALPVSGFIPPAAFMELQSLGVLPIASDIRTLEHLEYTPAPDIVHEAAGHAPILVNKDFANYLKAYAQVAKNAIISKEDLDVYEAIRYLSDIKEYPGSTSEQIDQAQKKLDQVSKDTTHISEASELSRMNWWTAEYGLIGDLASPKIFGAGLLSSVGESKWCLGDQVRKIPLTVDCVKQTYDITEPQPQLFVTPDFQTLSKVLEDFADQMAFRTGCLSGLRKALLAKTTTTSKWSSGLQVSGELCEIVEHEGEPSYLRFQGPCQLAFQEKELSGQGTAHHLEGFGSPVGSVKGLSKCLSQMTPEELRQKNVIEGMALRLDFASGISVSGTLKKITSVGVAQNLIFTFLDCTVKDGERILFEPSWGVYDMALGSKITSVSGGPADRVAFGEVDDFVALQIPIRVFTDKEKLLHSAYQGLRDLREGILSGKIKKSQSEIERELQDLVQKHRLEFENDWLLLIEALELYLHLKLAPAFQGMIENELAKIAAKNPGQKELIQDGARLAVGI